MDEKQILQILQGEFREKLSLLDNVITREATFPQAPNKIKVAIGMRRVGKTYFVYQQIQSLIDQGLSLSQILYINFEDDRLLPLDYTKLAKLIEAFYSLYPENHERKCYLFLDEIQNVDNWPIVIRRFFDSKNVEIYLTGSSAKLLSKEIASNLRGRSIATEIWPYSFTEYLNANNIQPDWQLYDKKIQDQLTHYFSQYLINGGFPEITHYQKDIRQQTLQEYVDIVIYRDIIERHNIKQSAIIKYMILSLINNVSNSFSINKFYNDLKSQGYNISKDSLYHYANFIEDTYLSFSVPLYDKSIRKAQINPKKIYAIDPGLICAITLNYSSDFGKLFENIIYLDFRRKGYTIHYYLTSQRYEIDFLVQSPQGKKKLFQVVWDMKNEETMKREQRALQIAMDELNLSGEIITLDSYLRNLCVNDK